MTRYFTKPISATQIKQWNVMVARHMELEQLSSKCDKKSLLENFDVDD